MPFHYHAKISPISLQNDNLEIRMNQKSILDWAKKDSSGGKRKFDKSETTNQKEEVEHQSKIAKTELTIDTPSIQEKQTSDDSRSDTCSPSLFEPELNESQTGSQKDIQPEDINGMTLSQTSEISFIPGYSFINY